MPVVGNAVATVWDYSRAGRSLSLEWDTFPYRPYGPMVSATELRRELLATMQKWFPPVLAQLSRQEGQGIDYLPPPQTYRRLPDFTALTDDQSPMCIVTSPGTVTEPHRDEGGQWMAQWRLNVFVVVRDESYEAVADKLGLYLVAAQIIGLQHGLSEMWHQPFRLAQTTLNELDTSDARTIGAGMVSFIVPIADMVSDIAGPIDLEEVGPAPEFEVPLLTQISSSVVTVDKERD